MNTKASIVANCSISLLLFLIYSPARATIITIKNDSAPQSVVTLSDFISYPNETASGVVFTTHLKPKDASDDINLAIEGTKNIDIGNDKSWTISWMNDLGQEVETDTIRFFDPFKVTMVAMFDSTFPGSYGIEYDFGAIGSTPTMGSTFPIDAFGHPIGAGLDWITFFDVTGSNTGFIERDPFGNPVSPRLPLGTEVTASFLWSISVVPEPSILSLVVLGLGTLIVRATGRHGQMRRHV